MIGLGLYVNVRPWPKNLMPLNSASTPSGVFAYELFTLGDCTSNVDDELELKKIYLGIIITRYNNNKIQ